MYAAVAEMFANRVRKNARHLAKWAKREGVTCYRVYDRDIPEVPLAVDRYLCEPPGGGPGELAIVVQDYRHADRGGGDEWLGAMTAAAAGVVEATATYVKQRERLVDRQAGHQYERLGERGVWRTVREGGHAFRVNLSDYVDTGLFLDHRSTRARVAAEQGATMLNLFAYTGAFSVYAAAAGMRTTTVDLSNTYLGWARDNLAANDLDGEIVHADVRDFLDDARRAGRRWDVVVCDPPTFSNSKRMDYTWDLQRDHVALLDDVFDVCDRVLWFSTNRKKFDLAWQHPHATITDETRATTPLDFRDARPHHAYRISRV
ncbi:MAG: class I SAM-dependent methyltransferase [Deltaproteobacteria bacterium]|nr:class I SAM-dependent methyltransferase [Deltaproteobacteria bacterium]